jgi:hypothetical protein
MVQPAAARIRAVSAIAQSARCSATSADSANSSGSVIGVLCRYSTFGLTAKSAAMLLAAWVKWRRGAAAQQVTREMLRLARYPAGAVIFFLCLSYASTGQWFVTGGFYVPDPTLQGQPLAVYEAIRQGVEDLAGDRFARWSVVAVVMVLIAALVRRPWSGLVLPLALLAAAALPFYAFISGHPFRIRYEVPLVLAGAAAIGTAVSLLRAAAPLVAAPILVLVMLQAPAFDREAAMVREAQLDRENGLGRRAVTACLARDYDGTTIMASMGSLAHYMQELSLAGFDLKDFLHEGSGPIWAYALHTEPSLYVGWVMIEEAAEGGDLLAQRHREWPGYLAGYQRVCEGGNVALYRRTGA